jgi:hypothetical protein
MMETEHSIKFSKSFLKKALKRMGLNRARAAVVSDKRIEDAVLNEVVGINRDFGYRPMNAILKKDHGIFVSEKRVLKAMNTVDQVGINFRKKKCLKRRKYYTAGPNYQWCIDGHDKLVPYGLAIHGCICSWSGKIIWLKVWSGNHSSTLIGRFYLESVRERGIVPFLTRMVCGTENVMVASMQSVFWEFAEGNEGKVKDYEFVKSTANIKIEGLWNRFLKAMGYNLMDSLRDAAQQNLWDEDDSFEYFLFLYLWIPLIQRYLDDWAELINSKVLESFNEETPKNERFTVAISCT